MDETHVVTCFLRNRGEVLLLKRSEAVGSYSGLWGGVAGHAEGAPDEAAREEVAEETGLLSACELARKGVAFEFTDSEAGTASKSRESPGDEDLGVRWVVSPYLFDCEDRNVETNRETTEFEWVHPTEMLRRETVPNLWAAYSRVAPTIEAVAEDSDHGSAYVSVRALEVLRDRAGSFAVRETGDWSALAAIAERLLDARPSMAAVGNRVNRAMADSSDEQTPAAVERAAREGIERAFRADEEAAENAADEIRDATVLTLSRSGTVLNALDSASRVFVAESRPAREGVGVAEELASLENGPDATLHTDAAVAHVLATEDVDAVVVGADAVLPDGRVVNKTGTRGAALAAPREGVAVYAVAATDKVRTDDAVHLEEGDSGEVYEGEADVSVLSPTFDVTPSECVSGVITERGVLDAEGISAVVAELKELSEWCR
ncbi:NUDIX domain-containing protein [Halorussus salilacus]|uniref:NUDIX domain-containing protein n=1 Tax=Halorussus salilacus TaxID=2953750 RepID=UPI00209F80FB|nr:NUDIX domain-containing protein [Halorussus salilacus]USZ67063.1 NUDIX domain-containing protein [Halorussus salilacus]